MSFTQPGFEDTQPVDTGAGARITALDTALRDDLMRFADARGGLEAIEVLAAARRHGRRLVVDLEHDGGAMRLTVYPAQDRLHSTLPIAQLLLAPLARLRVVQVAPATAAGADAFDGDDSVPPDSPHVGPLGPLLWALALRGSRDELLPEIAGPAAYRVPPGAETAASMLGGALAAAVSRLRREGTPLREIANWPGLDRHRAMRLLNGLYLQAALLVSRTHPAATNADWAPGAA